MRWLIPIPGPMDHMGGPLQGTFLCPILIIPCQYGCPISHHPMSGWNIPLVITCHRVSGVLCPKKKYPPYRPTALPPYRPAALPPCRPAALPPCRPAALQPYCHTTLLLYRPTIILPYHHSCTTIPHYCLIAWPPYCPTASRWWQWMHASWISVVWDVAQYNCQFVLHRLTAWDVPSYSRTSHSYKMGHPILCRASHLCEMGHPILRQSIPFVWDGMSHLMPERPIHVRWDVPSCARTSHSCEMGCPILCQNLSFM